MPILSKLTSCLLQLTRTCSLPLFGGTLLALAIPAQAAEQVVELELVHELGPDKGEQLSKLVERFNTTVKGIHIKVSSTPWTEGKPDLMILDSESEAQLLSRRGSIKPLSEILAAANVRVPTLAVPRMMSPASLDAKGRAQALPIGLGTPVMYANKQQLINAGIDPDNLPKTWLGWQEALGKIRGFGYNCPYTTSEPVSTFIENVSAWHNQPYAVGKKPEIAVNGLMQVKHLAFMNSWVRAQYLHFFGQGNNAENVFAQGNCVTLTAPSSAFPTLRRQAKFDVVVAPFPYHDGAYGAPQNTLADGPSMWVAAGRTPAEYKAVARFVSFWLTPESQVEWQVNAGYLPLNPSGLLIATSSKLLQDELQANRLAIAELTNKPTTDASAASPLAHAPGVRRVLGEEMENIWADRKPPKQAMDDAVMRIRSGRM
ncbi:extracellular solute-binding protein [Uliginosibacterium sp. H3]|uniref:sn-glycerol-3-phosphate-binding periplasmic protein UgpB n=1 Tax=Uliginosibacterium silvisoli TaxID=3114758 RepID=A0ABU6JY36_9RHOO|nr:extracellular solute-binding protein [Uliginosibacterium sp. H3]